MYLFISAFIYIYIYRPPIHYLNPEPQTGNYNTRPEVTQNNQARKL